jgi:hypothetical protein
MKTANEESELMLVHTEHTLEAYVVRVKQIQLDAAKWGMEQAAKIIVENNQPVFDLPTRLHTRQALGQAILTLSNNLNIDGNVIAQEALSTTAGTDLLNEIEELRKRVAAYRPYAEAAFRSAIDQANDKQ